MSKIIELVRLYAESYKNGWGTLHDVRSEVSRMEAELAECKAKLAALEVQSPVGEISAIRKNHVACVAWFRKPGAARTKLYLAAGAREAQPMTREEIDAAYVRHQNCAFALSFEGGVFAAEKHHGIGAKA